MKKNRLLSPDTPLRNLLFKTILTGWRNLGSEVLLQQSSLVSCTHILSFYLTTLFMFSEQV
ncbi:hypothetical protein C5167_029991 [Papaver somniferum]|nr:hypothetical protein C5167_029991 [Papaver somniferum]